MSSLWKDLRYGLRMLRLSPGFTLIAILTLALGIGANTAIFQLIDAIRLRTIPVKHPEELVTVRIADRHWGSGQFSGPYSQLTFPMWEQIRNRQQGFSQIAVWSTQQFNLATGGEVRYAKTLRVSGEFFQVLGVMPLLGRLLGPADDQPGCAIGGGGATYNPNTGIVAGGGAGFVGNIYTGHGAGGRGGFIYNTNTNAGIAAGKNNVYAGKDGTVYRYNRDSGSWSVNNGNGWQSFNRPEPKLERQQQMRNKGAQRTQNFNSARGFGGARMRGGGRRR